jgi:peptidyl-prolyl cis-trans isomerase A (cyclophilin A)
MDSATIGRRGLLGAAGLLLASPLPALAAGGKPRVAIHTGRGTIVVELESGKAPITSANFLHYIKTGKYDGGTIQGWPPPDTRRFPPIAHESTEKTGLKHDTGTISMGRYGPNTATADFFICASPEPYLDAHPDQPGDNQGYSAFGQVVEGMDIVRTILALPTKGKAYSKELRGQILTTPVPIITMKRI